MRQLRFSAAGSRPFSCWRLPGAVTGGLVGGGIRLALQYGGTRPVLE
ncbi:MAG: hypothetical protein ACLSGI_01670 [Butyricicoccaceae bacterium]